MILIEGSILKIKKNQIVLSGHLFVQFDKP